MTILEQAYQEGVKQACYDAGLAKEAGLPAMPPQATKILEAIRSAAQSPNAQRAAVGAALGGGAGALSAGEDDSALLRALVGAGIGGGAGAGAMPAFQKSKALLGRVFPGSQDVAGQVAARAAKPAAKPVAKPVAKPAAKPVAKPAAKR